MTDFLYAVILGIIEGLTEYIPVSSTAHLRLAQKLLQIPLEDEFWKMFAIVIQLGAILAVFTLFAKRLKSMVFGPDKTNLGGITLPVSKLFLNLIWAFLVTAIPAFLLSKVIDQNLESLTVIGASLLIGGIVMIFVDQRKQMIQTSDVATMTTKQAVAIGAIQILSAVFPGVSRSMSTIVGGQLVGLSRAAALEFSFLLSIPIMMAATGYDLLKYWIHNETGALASTQDWSIVAVGFVVSYLVAVFVVKWLMRWVQTKGFFIFGVYRIFVGAVILTLLR